MVEFVSIVEPPPLSVDLTSQYSIPLGGSVSIVPQVSIGGSNVLEYNWIPSEGLDCSDCPEPVASPPFDQVYILALADENGCVAYDTTEVLIKDQRSFYAPNAFTPNNDGKNDEWRVYGEGIKEAQIRVFDRWGSMIFETHDITQGWNGTYQGQRLGPDTYVATVVVRYIDNSAHMHTLSVLMIR